MIKPEPKESNFSFSVLIIFSCLFVVTRTFFLFLVKEKWLFFDRIDELYRGLIAKEFLEGMGHPLMAYAADDYGGGSIVIGIVTSLFFKFVGTNVFALKMTPFLFSFGTWFFWYLSLLKINTRIATLFTLLYIFAPFSFIQYSFATLGDHNESMFFTSLGIFIFLKMVYSPHKLLVLSFGIISGLALWFNYNYGITLAAILLYWFIMNRRFMFTSFFLITLIGIAIGLLPWILYNLETNFAGLILYDQPLNKHFNYQNLTAFWGDIREFVGYQILRAFQDPAVHPPAPRWTFYGYSLLTALFVFLSLIFLIVPQENPGDPRAPKKIRAPRHPVAIALIYLVVFSIIAQLSHYKKIHLMTIAHPFIFILVASALDRLWKRTKLFTSGAMIGFIFLASTSCIYAMSIEVNRLLLMKGYSYHGFSDGFSLSYFHPCRELEKCLGYYPTLKERASEKDLKEFEDGLVERISDIAFDEETPEYQDMMKLKLEKLIRVAPAELQPLIREIRQALNRSH